MEIISVLDEIGYNNLYISFEGNVIYLLDESDKEFLYGGEIPPSEFRFDAPEGDKEIIQAVVPEILKLDPSCVDIHYSDGEGRPHLEIDFYVDHWNCLVVHDNIHLVDSTGVHNVNLREACEMIGNIGKRQREEDLPGN